MEYFLPQKNAKNFGTLEQTPVFPHTYIPGIQVKNQTNPF
jgi:hypothetical protein